MIPREYSIFDHGQTNEEYAAEQYTTEDSEIDDSKEPNWAAVVGVGFLFLFIGFALLQASEEAGVVFAIFGLLLILGAGAVRKWEMEEANAQIASDEWVEDEQLRDLEAYDQYRQSTRQQEIDEIVKAVKSTIRVRCRYCGTLNEEKANNCESCGAAL